MGSVMIVHLADNIITPLGFSSDENFRNVLAGKTMICKHDNVFDLPEPFCASLFNREKLKDVFHRELDNTKDLTLFEKLWVLSIKKAVEKAEIDPSDHKVIFILSTTKGNVEYLSNSLEDDRCYIFATAKKISDYFGNRNNPIVVSNACISGINAQIAAVRELLSGSYEYAIVTGCDILSKFIISGFQSFKALSLNPCQPFDVSRDGLNLGEGAATMILKATESINQDSWLYTGSSIHNDANHISGPSRTGEGSFRVLSDLLQNLDKEQIGLVGLHGTATPYNDEMESIALYRAGLDKVPSLSYKGYFGHTLGAAGIAETIMCMKAIDNQIIPATRGFHTKGTTYELGVRNEKIPTTKNTFIKLMSGFGGTNAGISYRKGVEK